jgi:hypothetical protein
MSREIHRFIRFFAHVPFFFSCRFKSVLEIISEKNRVRLETAFSNQKGEAVITGEAVVMPPPQ